MSEYIYNTAKVETQPEQGFTGEEIVRCRDCEYLAAHGTGCAHWDYCDIESVDGFCKWGTRRGK